MRDVIHIYGQYSHHTEAYIVGTREGLFSLAHAILRVAERQQQGEHNTFANDGEGYSIYIIPLLEEKTVDSLAVPYTAIYAQENRPEAVHPYRLVSKQGNPG